MRFLTWMFIARTSRIYSDVGYTAKIQILKQITTLSNNIAGNELMSGAPQRYIKNVFTKKTTQVHLFSKNIKYKSEYQYDKCSVH